MANMAALTFKEVPYKNVGGVLIFFPEATELISGYTTESISHGHCDARHTASPSNPKSTATTFSPITGRGLQKTDLLRRQGSV